MLFRPIVTWCAATALCAQSASAQTTESRAPVIASGPRVGVTVLSQQVIDHIADRHNREVGAILTQFGWQVERQFRTKTGGPVGLADFVFLVGGAEQGLLIPSVTALIGMRTPGGFEFGAGPNISPIGVALAFTVGITMHASELSVPLNFGFVPSEQGSRATILIGFNLGS
jgi:hypothetical protein